MRIHNFFWYFLYLFPFLLLVVVFWSWWFVNMIKMMKIWLFSQYFVCFFLPSPPPGIDASLAVTIQIKDDAIATDNNVWCNFVPVFCLSLLIPPGINGSNSLLLYWGPSKASWSVLEIIMMTMTMIIMKFWCWLGPGRPSAGGPRMDRWVVTCPGVVKISRLASRLQRSARRSDPLIQKCHVTHRLPGMTLWLKNVTWPTGCQEWPSD